MHSTIHGNLEAALNALVQRTWGTDQNIASGQRISQRAAIVTRLSRLAAPSPPSIIAKHVFDAEFPLSEHPHASPEFQEELLEHVFLQQIDAEEGLKPQLFA
jgi:hypothetical protein